MIYSYLIIVALLFVLELLYFRIADRFNIIDKPNLRSSHTHITLRGGGIIFLISMWLYAAFFGLHYPWFLGGLTLITLVSFIDDIHSLPNRYRLLCQFAAMFMMFAQWGVYNAEQWWFVALALIFCTGVINAYNFMDGINGITGGYSLIVLLSLLVANNMVPVVESSLIIVALLGVVVFCVFNFRTRAKCFAGDVGAVGIAFIILFVMGGLCVEQSSMWYIIFLAMYGEDSILTIVHRLMLHENIFEAHRKHAYQIMANELHIPHVVVSLIYMAVQAVISAGALWLNVNRWVYFVSVIVVLCVAYVVFMRRYYHLHAEYLATKK